jgi:hypothetical protein
MLMLIAHKSETKSALFMSKNYKQDDKLAKQLHVIVRMRRTDISVVKALMEL